MHSNRTCGRGFVVALALAAGSSVSASPALPPHSGDPVPARPDVSALFQNVWVYFRDKGVAPGELDARLRELERDYPVRAVERRRLRRSLPALFDERDLPVSSSYIDAVVRTGVTVRAQSRWLNAVSVRADARAQAALRALSCVDRVVSVRAGTRIEQAPAPFDPDTSGGNTRAFYGFAEGQLNQIDVPAVHAQGFTGSGVVIGILDTGFYRAHPAFHEPGHELDVIAERDFINDDNNTGPQAGDDPGQHYHGTLILGTIGAYRPGELVGAAYDASFVLAKTEDITSETPVEEDYYVEGLEFIEFHGADVATSSLGYIDWYTQSDLDGQTAVTSIAVNIATANGVHCCTAAGNSGHDADPGTSHLIAPADAFDVISCGAAYQSGPIAEFSSDGPTADGRVKPEILAQGVETVSVAADDSGWYWAASGTSLSTPLVAGAVACLTQARPDWTVAQMRTFLFASADDFLANGQADPQRVRGYGVMNTALALAQDCNANGQFDSIDVISGSSTDFDENSVPDECDCLADWNSDGTLDAFDYDDFVSAFFLYVTTGVGSADYNGDGTTDAFDYDDFVNAFFTGCR